MTLTRTRVLILVFVTLAIYVALRFIPAMAAPPLQAPTYALPTPFKVYLAGIDAQRDCAGVMFAKARIIEGPLAGSEAVWKVVGDRAEIVVSPGSTLANGNGNLQVFADGDLYVVSARNDQRAIHVWKVPGWTPCAGDGTSAPPSTTNVDQAARDLAASAAQMAQAARDAANSANTTARSARTSANEARAVADSKLGTKQVEDIAWSKIQAQWYLWSTYQDPRYLNLDWERGLQQLKHYGLIPR